MVVPIRQLQAGAQRLGEGDLRQRISLDSQDEIGALARRFNDMAGRIQEAQETLEAKVVERTHELNERTDDLTVALERQTATAEVLQAITATPDDPQPVFDLIVRHVSRLARSATASIFVYDGERLHRRADHGYTPEVLAELRAGFPRPPAADFVPGRVVLAGEVVHVADLATEAGVNPSARGMGARSYLGIPLRHHGRVIGVLGLGRADIGAFDDTAVALAHSFAEQAVIAISGAATLHELQSRTTELEAALEQQTATAEVLRLISSTTYDLGPVFHKLVETAARLCQSDRTAVLLVENGKFRPETAVGFPDEYGRFVRRIADDVANFEGVAALPRALRERRTIHYEDIAGIPGYPRAPIELGRQRTVLALPLLRDGEAAGAMILSRESVAPFTERQIALAASFADQAAIAVENVRLLAELRERTAEAERALAELRLAQDRLVQTEKLASLGQLTAGIAHEIKNPLNFVNNFAELSAELVQELEEALAKAGEAVPDALREEVTELAEILRGNLAKVVQHGKRADSIVRNMLAHSREGGGERRQLALNPLVEEAMNLAWHGARAEKPGLNVTLEKDFDPAAGDVSLFPQEFTRVLLNLVGNAVYATGLRGQRGEPGYEPVVRVSTRALGDAVEVRVRDNGTGIPEAMRRRIFEPFFTTKPAGEGTGLGLSLSHDIVVKQHGGSFTVASEEGSFTEFRVLLPQGAREKA
jgi:signal transduction histidine kinase